jgi:hypothetical protein
MSTLDIVKSTKLMEIRLDNLGISNTSETELPFDNMSKILLLAPQVEGVLELGYHIPELILPPSIVKYNKSEEFSMFK